MSVYTDSGPHVIRINDQGHTYVSASSDDDDVPYQYTYRAPSISRSKFTSSVATGSRSLHSGDYTAGSGSQRKLRNGILQTEIENTASSSRPPKMVYVKNDPTKTLAPMSSWKQLPGQIHPTTRQKLGHSDLRKVRVGKIIKKKK